MEVYLSRSAKYGLPFWNNTGGTVTNVALFPPLLFCKILAIKHGSRLIVNTLHIAEVSTGQGDKKIVFINRSKLMNIIVSHSVNSEF